MLIAIDGPAASGKSAIAKKLSKILNIKYIETGALYRAIAYYIIKSGIKDFGDFGFLRSIKIEQKFENGEARTFLNDEDISEIIRDEEISNVASVISGYKEVREFLLGLQRELSKCSAIVEGRDIGTVVLPYADFKFFITASVEERARRRYNQLKEKGISYEDILENLKQRDKMDSEREISPLRPARDAFVIDTTDMSEDKVVKLILDIIEKNLKIGTIISREGQKLLVFVNNNTLRAVPRGKVIKKYEKIYVGDIVIGRIENGQFVIEDIKERKNVILRPPIANVSKVILLFTIVEPEFVSVQLDKLLCAYEYLNVDILIVFNKIDIAPRDELEKIINIYQNAGYDVIGISVKGNIGLQVLKNKIRGDLIVLSGPSGVGKSSLIRALIGLDIKIGELSIKSKRGTQTTTTVSLYFIDNETFIADTPGFSKIDLSLIMKEQDIKNYFREFRRYKCAFRNCLHIDEENCSIKEAVLNGEISSLRYESYIKIVKALF